MNATEKLLTAKLLRMASDRFSNHGCNDFRMENNFDNRELLLAAEPDFVPLKHVEATYLSTQDWLLMDYFAKKLEAEATS